MAGLGGYDPLVAPNACRFGLIPLLRHTNPNYLTIFTAFFLGVQHQRDSAEIKQSISLVVSLGKALNGTPTQQLRFAASLASTLSISELRRG